MCGFAVYTGADENIKTAFSKDFYSIKHRGPDNSTLVDLGRHGWLGFHRLKIVDLSEHGNQPLIHQHIYLLCNGEIYNNLTIRDRYKSFPYQSTSDCESILPLFLDLGIIETARALDAEFAFVLHDHDTGRYMAARDPIGIRPLFYGYASDGKIAFASEMKALHNTCKHVKPFPPGYVFDGEEFVRYSDVTKVDAYTNDADEVIYKKVNHYLTEGIRKRLQADAPLGFLLSGGLDSSVVAALGAQMSNKPIRTFAVGLNEGAIDLKYAKIVADYIGSDHMEIIFTMKDVFDNLHHLIYLLETWDITTIRASVGMYLMCKHISNETNVRTLLTGEISDELFGYKYTDFAPDANAFQEEAAKRIREIYIYDVLRADRSLAGTGLEARVPFGDLDFVKYVMSIPPEKKMNTTGVGKYLLRKSFDDKKLLPDEILWREKAAFSDAVGHGMVDYLKAHANALYSDDDLANATRKYPYHPPFTKESLMYRDIFESHFPGRAELIQDYWMPNKSWNNCDVNDPSARALPNYGKSGV
jgi:asparagine synthase (glutamine-hydrolysing)